MSETRAKTWTMFTNCTQLTFPFYERNEKLFFLAIKKGVRAWQLRERRGTIFSDKMDNFIAADFTTQSGIAEVSGTTMVTLVIVFPESSDKGEFYNHVGYRFVSHCRISDISCNL